MGSLYFLAFRDVATTSLGVTAGEVYRLDNVDPGTVWDAALLPAANWVPWGQVANLFRGKRICFIVHGFNVSVDHGVKVAGPPAQEFESLGGLGLAMTAADMVVPVLWPGDGLIGWSWFNAFQTSAATGRNFAQFLTSSAFTAASVSFFSHSLGARVVLETISQAKGLGSTLDFDTAVLTAAAVDDDALDDPQYAGAAAALNRIVVLSSVRDEVLAIAFTIGDPVEGALWWNYHPDARALGRYGPAFAAKSAAVGKSEWYEVNPNIGQGHEDYLPMGWNPPPQVWSQKQQNSSWFVREILDLRPLPPAAPPDWGIDHTASFRPGWTPKF